MTVRQLLNNISSSELTEWMAYSRIKQSPAEEKVDTARVLKDMLGHKVVKKGKKK